MTIIYKHGDMFTEPAEAIVNTVNCVGVMGKGVALQFKKRWPDNYKAYKQYCDKKLLVPGNMFVFEKTDMFGDGPLKFLINFPTKLHWRSKSKLSYIEDGLDDFITKIKQYNIKSVVIPPLGCGNGGLEWPVVKKLMEAKLADIDDVDFILYTPREADTLPEHENIPSEMTTPRAALVKTLGDFEVFFGGSFTRLSLQKITYFLQILGIDFELKFVKEQFGPYSAELHNALKAMERCNYIKGYVKNDAITATPSAYAVAEEHISDIAPMVSEVISKLSHLIDGFESPFGMELLSSVYYLYDEKKQHTVDEILADFSNWNDHKKDTFGKREIDAAITRLTEDGLMN